MLSLRSPFLVACLYSFSHMLSFCGSLSDLAVKAFVAFAPGLSSGLSLPLTLVSKCRKVNMCF